MSVTIVDKPRDWSFSRHKLVYSCTSDETGQTGFKFVVEVKRNTDSIGKWYVDPNPSGVLIFDIVEAIRGQLYGDVEDKDGNIIHELPHNVFQALTTSTNSTDVFTVEFNEAWGDPLAEQTVSATHTLQIANGESKIREGLHPNLFDYEPTLLSHKVWLTDRPLVNQTYQMYASDDDYGTLAFWNADGTYLAGAQKKIKYELFNDSGSQGSLEFTINSTNGASTPTSATRNEKMVFFGALPANINEAYHNITSPKPMTVPDWTHYTLSLVDNSSNRMSLFFYVYRDFRPCKHEPVQIAWVNSVGGWDYFRMDARRQTSINVERKSYRKSIGDYSGSTYTMNTWDRGKTNYHNDTTELIRLDSGAVEYWETGLLKNVLKSDNVMIRLDGQWIPVVVQTNSVNYTDEPISQRQSIQFTVEIAQKPC